MMEGRVMKKTSGSSRRMYIRSIADIITNWNDMESTSDINKLYAIVIEEKK